MPQQLVLIDPESDLPRPAGAAGVRAGEDWHLDAETREIGLRGIAEARSILLADARHAGERSAA
ncbi:MAG TPA: hypothetical protein VFZ97_02540 [Acidimicrobiales bacterium]